MIDIKSKKCIICKKIRPYFNHEGELIATHCKRCAEFGMIDIINPKCIICKKQASYGIPCNSPTTCSQHKTENMIKNPRSKCRKKDCNNMSLYGIKFPVHCDEHKNENDICLVERICSKCGKLDILINNICVNFCHNEELYKDFKKHRKVKEIRVLNILKSAIGEPSEYNHRIQNECGKEEKEIGYDCGSHKIFIEVDERQHKSYNCPRNEINRMRNIWMAEGGIPIIFVRYNPDTFIDSNGKKLKIPQAAREELLIKWLKLFIEREPKSSLSVKYLFYDNHDNNEYYEIDPYDTNEYTCDMCNQKFYIKQMYEKHIKACDDIIYM